MSTSSPSGPEGDRGFDGPRDGGRQPGAGRAVQPLRAAAVVVVAAIVAVVVLARMGGHTFAASSPTTTAASHRTTTTTVPTSVASSTTSTTAIPTIAPARVTVVVLNGYSVAHAALYFQQMLIGDGYDTLAPSNATAETSKLSEVFVLDPATRANAVAIARLIGASPSAVMTPTAANDSQVPVTLLHQAHLDIVVVIGADVSGQIPSGYTGPTTTTTTLAVTTTTAA